MKLNMEKLDNIDLINYIINKGATAKEAAEYFGVSLSAVRKKLASIKESLQDNSEIKNQLLSVINNNQDIGRIKGGLSHNSGAKMTDTIVSIAEKAIYVLANNLTIEEASIKFNIPTSTLFEHFKKLANPNYHQIYTDLQSLFAYHKSKRYITNTKAIFSIQQKYMQLLNKNNNEISYKTK